MNKKTAAPDSLERDRRPLILMILGLVLLTTSFFHFDRPAPPPHTAYSIRLDQAGQGSLSLMRRTKTAEQNRAEESSRKPIPARLAPFFFKPVPINRADAASLTTVRGIGPSLAGRIIALREKKGAIERPEELLAVRGIGPKKLAQVAPHLSFE